MEWEESHRAWAPLIVVRRAELVPTPEDKKSKSIYSGGGAQRGEHSLPNLSPKETQRP